MNMVLNKRIKRDLKSNFLRYLALFLLIAFGMYIIVAIVGAADTIITGTKQMAEENKVEDGQFGTFIPLSEEQEETIRDMGITLERMFSVDLSQEDGSTLRVFANREEINRIHVDEGCVARTDEEVVIEKRYAEEHNLAVGDTIEMAGKTYFITGVGSVPEYDMPIATFSDTAVESSLFGLAFVTDEAYEDIINTEYAGVETYCYAYRLNGVATHEELKDEFLTVEVNNLTSFIKAENNGRIHAAAGDLLTNRNVGLVAGIIIMILFTYVISVFVIHQIQQESSVIGTLYALGAKKRNLVSHYIMLPTVISLVGGLVGTAAGFSDWGIAWQMADTYMYFSIPDLEPGYAVYLIIYGVVMPPVISAIVNYIVIDKKLSRTALSLIRNEQKISHRSRVNLGKMGFLRRFQIRQMLREARTGLTVVFGMFITMLIFMMGLNCYVLCENVRIDSSRDATFEYMYTLKYPEETPPKESEACYLKSLSITDKGYTLDVSIIGIDENNKYYKAEPIKGKSNVIVSSAAAQKYNLSVGDKIILTDSADDMDYAFTVKGIAEYGVSLAFFMDIKSMRELFDEEEDYYNMLLSDEELEIEADRIYSVTQREDIERASSVFTKLMKPMFVMMISVSIVIFIVVMYLMLNVMIDRASFGISLVKIFGFRTGEIRKLYLNGNTAIVAVGAVISIPLAKYIMDRIYPFFIANTACGINCTFPIWYYALIFAGVMAVYFAVSGVLVFKIKKILPAEVLKNRE